MQTSPAGTGARTRYEALLDVRYNVRFHELNERFYGRLDLAFGALGLIAGTAAFAGFVATRPELAGAAGSVIAVLAIVERLVRPVHRQFAHQAYRRAYAELDADAAALSLPLQDIDRRLRALGGEGPSGIKALEIPAHNANLLTHGHERSVLRPPLLSRLAALLA